MLTDSKLIKFINEAILALELDRDKAELSTVDTAFISGKLEAFKEIRDYGTKRTKTKS